MLRFWDPHPVTNRRNGWNGDDDDGWNGYADASNVKRISFQNFTIY